MSLDEVVAILKAYDEATKQEYERLRVQCFYGSAGFSKAKQPKDLFKFPWDNERKKTEGPIKTRTKEEALAKLQEMRKNRQDGR
jgi:hypothetical protein